MIFSNSLNQFVINCQDRPGSLYSSSNASPGAKAELSLASSTTYFKRKGYMESILH